MTISHILIYCHILNFLYIVNMALQLVKGFALQFGHDARRNSNIYTEDTISYKPTAKKINFFYRKAGWTDYSSGNTSE